MTITIPPFFSQDSYDYPDYLYGRADVRPDCIHVSTFQIRKNIQIPQAIELAMEMPNGCFLSGGFVKSALANKVPNNYDIFFNGSRAFESMLRRIHNAPEGSFLHGYTSDKSAAQMRDRAGGKVMLFKHPTKPPLQLVRIRYYDTAADLIDKSDFTVCMFALDNQLMMTYTTDAVEDARAKRLRLNKVSFYNSTGIRIQNLEKEGYMWADSGRYSNYDRRDMINSAKGQLKRNSSLATELFHS